MFLWIPEAIRRVKQAPPRIFSSDRPSAEKASKPTPQGAICPEHRTAARSQAQQGRRLARIYKTRDWRDQLSPSIEEFELMALEAYAHLPQEFRDLTGEIVIQVAEFPTDEIMDDLSLETPFDLLGLFEGRGIAERWNPATGEGPNRITLYRRAILDYWAENEESLGAIINHVLIHEIGHHFGLSDDDMERIEASTE
jgi:predicted Zn-dependent protease with MMP-like domain